MMCKFIFFDTETTGLRPGQIAQLSFIVENNGGIEAVKNYYFRVDKMDEEAERVHGLSKEKLEELSGGLRFKDVSGEVYRYFDNSKLVAHNLKFDEQFISIEFWRAGKVFKPADRFCTMEFFKEIMKIPSKNLKYGKYKNPSLKEVVDYFNINEEVLIETSRNIFKCNDVGYHDSRFDVTAMYVAYKIYNELLYGKREWSNKFCKR